MKIYVLVKTYQEDFSDGQKILCVTENYTKIRDRFESCICSRINEYPDWFIDRNDLSYFHHHHPEETGDFTEFEIKILTEEELQRLIDELTTR